MNIVPEPTPPGILSRSEKPRIGVIREEGSNGDREMASAFHAAGFEPWDVTMTDLIAERIDLERFRRAYRERFGMEPETYAAHGYDGMNMLLWAIQVAGLNRAKIRDVIAHLPYPWPGVTGDIVLSAALDDVAETYLAKYEDGGWRYHSRSDLEIPSGYIPPRDRLNREQAAAAAAR